MPACSIGFHDAAPITHLLGASVASFVNGTAIDLTNVLWEPPVSHLLRVYLCSSPRGFVRTRMRAKAEGAPAGSPEREHLF